MRAEREKREMFSIRMHVRERVRERERERADSIERRGPVCGVRNLLNDDNDSFSVLDSFRFLSNRERERA